MVLAGGDKSAWTCQSRTSQLSRGGELPRDPIKMQILLQQVWGGAESIVLNSEMPLLLLGTDHTLSNSSSGSRPWWHIGISLESHPERFRFKWSTVGLGNRILKNLPDDWNIPEGSLLAQTFSEVWKSGSLFHRGNGECQLQWVNLFTEVN